MKNFCCHFDTNRVVLHNAYGEINQQSTLSVQKIAGIGNCH